MRDTDRTRFELVKMSEQSIGGYEAVETTHHSVHQYSPLVMVVPNLSRVEAPR